MGSRITGATKVIDVSTRDDWRHWLELGVLFRGFPPSVRTRDVWKAFKEEGEIVTIELFDNDTGELTGRGRVRFSPPPNNAFWQRSNYLVGVEGDSKQYSLSFTLSRPKRDFLQPSLVNPKRRYPESMALSAEYLDFGFMFEPTTMMGMYRAKTTASNVVVFRLNLLHREIEVTFQIAFRDPKAQGSKVEGSDSRPGKPIRFQDYVFVIPLAQATVIHQMESGQQLALLLSLETPPNFYRKYNGLYTHQPGATYWNRRNALFRQTDIIYDPRKMKDASLTLKKTRPTIDIGRWNTYHFNFDLKKTDRGMYTTMCKALRDFNIEILPLPQFKLATDREPAVWEYIDRPVPSTKGKILAALDELMAENVPPLPFPVRYQLEVCISEGWLNEYNMTKEFVDKLMDLESIKAQDLLEYIANQRRRVFNPMDIFDIKILRGSASRLKIPHYCTYVRSATVTPTMIYFSTPYVETSNRILRQYAEHADRFLRVRFTDEKFQGKLNSNEGESMNEIYTRVKRALHNGITIGDRHFEYLASGNSQFREHGAYFFCPLAHLGVADIRRWMGDFQDIKVVAKYAARLGQCFSTTRAITGSRVHMIEIPDISNGRFLFTDGVGKISRFLAQIAASEVGVHMPIGEPPSVFQFRIGGAKGVLALSPDAKMREIHIRNSQYKFHAIHSGLEIIRWSQFSAAHLNRQLIVVLSALQVPNEVFLDMLKTQLSNMAQAMTDEKMALTLLQKEIDPNQMTLAVAALILDGFQSVQEPFMLSLLQLWRAWSTKYLKEKAKIVVHKGAVLLGCVDETRSLKGHFDNLQHLRVNASEEERIKSLPEVFVQLSKGASDKPRIMLGPMILARNPSLHPGDIRVVCGVDVPALRHLKDVVALPQTGDRDVAHMCSGGDLDGDDYLVIWDKGLLPHEWNHPPMDYTPPEPVVAQGNVTTDDITTFFVNYMKNDTLPRIAHAHLAYADHLEKGVKDGKCLALAALHSRAVDYMKTGVHAELPAELRPKRWPHFMEKRHKPKDQIYVSRKVLGQLYDQVERVDFAPEFETPFDERILKAHDRSEELLVKAAEVKFAYDAAMYRIMAQYEIGTEFEVWSTFVLQHANQSKDFKFHEEMGAISFALKDRFRTACYEKAGGREFDKMGPFAAAMYHVTNDQVVEVLERRRQLTTAGKLQKGRQDYNQSMPLISFPWLFAGILGKIANGELVGLQNDRQAPASSLQGQLRNITPKKRGFGHAADGEEDVLKTAEGLVHRGELLKLFDHDEGPDSSPSGTSGPATPDGNNVTQLSVAKHVGNSLLVESITERRVVEANAPQSSTEATVETQETQVVSQNTWTGLERIEKLDRTAKEVWAPGSDMLDQRGFPGIVKHADQVKLPIAGDVLIDLGFEDGNGHQLVNLLASDSNGCPAALLLDLPNVERIAAKHTGTRGYPGSSDPTALFDSPLGEEFAVGAIPLPSVNTGLVEYEEYISAVDEADEAELAAEYAGNGEGVGKRRKTSQESQRGTLEVEEKDEAFIEIDGQRSLLERLTLLVEV